jgi:hypothetical protein
VAGYCADTTDTLARKHTSSANPKANLAKRSMILSVVVISNASCNVAQFLFQVTD